MILVNISVVIRGIIFILGMLLISHKGVILGKFDLSRKSKMAAFRAELLPIFIILGNISFVYRGIIFFVSMLVMSHTRVDKIDLSITKIQDGRL